MVASRAPSSKKTAVGSAAQKPVGKKASTAVGSAAKKPADKKASTATAASRKPATKKTVATKPALEKTAAKAGAAATPARKTTTRKVGASSSAQGVAPQGKPGSKGGQKVTVSPEERYQMIAAAAYWRAECRNFAVGGALDDWIAAEAEIDAKLGL